MDESSKTKLAAFRRVVANDMACAQLTCLESLTERTMTRDISEEMKLEFLAMLNEEFINIQTNLAITRASI